MMEHWNAYLIAAINEEDLVNLIFLAAIVLISALSAIAKKANEWINKKRMEVDRRQARTSSMTQKAEERQAPSMERRPPRPVGQKPAQKEEEGEDLAEKILRQIEAMLPPEEAAARREARERAKQESQSSQTQTAPQPVERPAPRPTPQRPAPSRMDRPPDTAPPRVEPKRREREVFERKAQPPPQVRVEPKRRFEKAPQAEAQPYQRPSETPYRRPTTLPAGKAGTKSIYQTSLGDGAAKIAWRAPSSKPSKVEVRKRLGLKNYEDVRRAFLFKEIIDKPLCERKPTPYT